MPQSKGLLYIFKMHLNHYYLDYQQYTADRNILHNLTSFIFFLFLNSAKGVFLDRNVLESQLEEKKKTLYSDLPT